MCYHNYLYGKIVVQSGTDIVRIVAIATVSCGSNKGVYIYKQGTDRIHLDGVSVSMAILKIFPLNLCTSSSIGLTWKCYFSNNQHYASYTAL